MTLKKRMGRPIATLDTDNPLARLRKLKGWSQDQAAQEIGFESRTAISLIERGLRKLTGPAKKRVLELLEESE